MNNQFKKLANLWKENLYRRFENGVDPKTLMPIERAFYNLWLFGKTDIEGFVKDN